MDSYIDLKNLSPLAVFRFFYIVNATNLLLTVTLDTDNEKAFASLCCIIAVALVGEGISMLWNSWDKKRADNKECKGEERGNKGGRD